MRYGALLLPALLLVAAPGIDAVAAPGPPQADESSPPPPGAAAVLGAPPAFDLSGEESDRVWVAADALLHRQPAERSPVLTRLPAAAELPVLERRGGWARVRYGSWQGWVLVDGDEPAVAPAGIAIREPPAAAWAPPAGADPRRLAAARGFLASERVTTLGAFELYTDVADDALLAKLSRLARGLPQVFERRYGLAATPGEDEAVVLFAREESYREYARADDDGAAVDSLGHAVGGLAVLATGGRQRDEIRSLLVHELTHLLSYRALGPALPPWLAEGLAEDLAYCRVTSAGEIRLGTLDGWRTVGAATFFAPNGRLESGIETVRGGPEVSLELLRARWHDADRPPLARLLELRPAQFREARLRSLHYAMSGFLVRYLLASDELAGGFLSFLRHVARGGGIEAGDLGERLGTGLDELEAGFADWIASNAPRRAPDPRRPREIVTEPEAGLSLDQP